MDRILDRDLNEEDLLSRSTTMELNPDLHDPPALLLLNPDLKNPVEDSNNKSGVVSFVCYHGGHLCKYEINV
jgi:hypothetical protein